MCWTKNVDQLHWNISEGILKLDSNWNSNCSMSWAKSELDLMKFLNAGTYIGTIVR